jgi:hypothetical protein
LAIAVRAARMEEATGTVKVALVDDFGVLGGDDAGCVEVSVDRRKSGTGLEDRKRRGGV